MEDKMTTKSPAEVNAVEEAAPFNPVTDNWETVVSGADEILGHDLAKDANLDALEGVPFLITKVVFRPGDKGKRESYATLEIVLASQQLMERRNVNLNTLPFDPGDLVVINDGGTGIYRQIVAYLHAKGFVALPEPLVVNGKGPRWDEKAKEMVYACSYDLPPNAWTDVNAGDMRYDDDGKPIYTANVRIFAKRGIRVSDYSNDFGEGKTRYLA